MHFLAQQRDRVGRLQPRKMCCSTAAFLSLPGAHSTAESQRGQTGTTTTVESGEKGKKFGEKKRKWKRAYRLPIPRNRVLDGQNSRTLSIHCICRARNQGHGILDLHSVCQQVRELAQEKSWRDYSCQRYQRVPLTRSTLRKGKNIRISESENRKWPKRP